ncbi:MAG: FusB/FusC family EF-G-binding protein [Cellulosilyticaceae bacterium]
MEPFIQKHEYNKIRKYLRDLNNTFRNCTDQKIIETSKANIGENIFNIFQGLSNDQRELIDISKLNDISVIDERITNLEQYVYGMPNVNIATIRKVLKKEKKLKMPSEEILNSKNVYLGWIDESVRKLFIIYYLDNKWVSMACRIPNISSTNTNICTLCNYVGKEDEVTFVSPICKMSDQDAYKSIGFHICLDSKQCNERITSTEKLEKLLKTVNNRH